MTSRARAAIVRIAIAAAVIGGVVWWLQSRGTSPSTAAPQMVPGGGGGGGGKGGGGKGGGGGDRVVPVQVATVEQKDLPIWLEGLGTVMASQQVTVRPQVDGRLDAVLFTEGQAVKKGDVLAQIDPRPFLVQLHQAQGALARDRAQLDAAKRNLVRYQGLQKQNLVAQQQVDELAGQVGALEGSVRMDLSQVENAQLLLDYAKVKAPFDGVTGVRLVDAGNLVRAADPNGLVVITAIDPAAVMFTVPQDRLTGVATALARGEVPVEIWNRDGTAKLATGKLAVLDNQVNQATATLRLKALVPNPDRVLWPNAFVKARMLLETRTGAVVIPSVAVQRGPQGTFVYVAGDDKTAQMRTVTVGIATGDVSVIEKGVAPGEQVVIEGQAQLRPGGKLEVARPAGGKDGPAERPARGGSGSAARGR